MDGLGCRHGERRQVTENSLGVINDTENHQRNRFEEAASIEWGLLADSETRIICINPPSY